MAAPQANMLSGLGKLTELKQRILFVVLALIVYRLGSFIPVPGVNSEAMSALIERQGGGVDAAEFGCGWCHGGYSGGVDGDCS